MAIGDVVYSKDHIFTLREEHAAEMEVYRQGVESFINKYNFYPKVFYNENDINNPTLGIRAAIDNLDDYEGLFIHQDAPDTPIDNFGGVEFRTSLTKSIRDKHSAKQLLWTIQDMTSVTPLPPSEYHEEPTVQFAGTVVYHESGNPFPQQAPRFQSLFALGTSGLKVQLNVKMQQFIKGNFIEISGSHLNDEDYNKLKASHPYGLSVRGWGNWDFRMYELLASGRIPVHIMTDDELLFEREIDWRDYMVIVHDVRHIKEAVMDFHSQFTDDRSLRNHQSKLVKLYHEKLSFKAFCNHFEDYYMEDLQRWNVI